MGCCCSGRSDKRGREEREFDDGTTDNPVFETEDNAASDGHDGPALTPLQHRAGLMYLRWDPTDPSTARAGEEGWAVLLAKLAAADRSPTAAGRN